MSVLEDLRELIASMYTFVKLENIMMSSYLVEHPDSASKRLKDVLTDMIDNIELREAAVAATDWNAVRDVSTEMKRYVFGRLEIDNLVYAWASSLDKALAGREGHQKSDADRPRATCEKKRLTPEDAEAMTWVREHGGIDRVRAQWGHLARRAGHADRVDRALARRQRQIDESHAALRRRNDRIRSLASELNRAHSENHAEFMRRAGDYAAFADEVCERLASELRHVEGCAKDVMDAALEALDRRLMPEGLEWPRYESGEPVPIGGEFMGKDGKTYTAKQIQFIGKCFSLYDFCDRKPQFSGFYGECVKRPAVLAADGEPLEVGQTVWHEDGTELRVLGFGDEEDGETIVRVEYVDGPTDWSEVRSLSLTHAKPEPADSWERIEEDADALVDAEINCEGSYNAANAYCNRRGLGEGTSFVLMAQDLVRRCRALAERERGE